MKKITLLLVVSLFLQQAMAIINGSSYPMTISNSAALLTATGSRTQLLSSSGGNSISSVQTFPFTFSFDGTAYTQFSASPDGFIKLGASAASSQSSNSIFSNNNVPKIAPFWDNLTLASSGNGGGVYAFVNGTAPSRVFVIEWVVRSSDNENYSTAKFQVALYESSNNIAFFYQGLNPSSSIYNDYSIGFTNRTTSSNNQASVYVSNNSVSYSTAKDDNSTKIPDTRSYLFSAGAIVFSPSINLTYTNVTTSSMTIGFTPGSGTNHLVLCRAGNDITTDPSNLSSYNANTVYGSGSSIGSAYVIYNGTGSSVNLTGLSTSTNYFFKVYEQTGTGSSATFNTSSLLSGNQGSRAIVPSTPPAVSPVPPVTSATTVNFTCSKGNGERRMVMCQKDNDVNSDPEDGRQYSAHSEYGRGDHYENGYVVYDGTDNNFNISGLEGGAHYHFTIVEYNGNGTCATYNKAGKIKTTSETNAAPPATPSGSGSFGEISSDALKLNFTKGDGARRIVVCRKGSEINDDANDGHKYRADSTFGSGEAYGSGYVVYDGTENSCRVKHLDDNSNYHFTVIEYNGDNDKTTYDNTHKYKCSASTPRTDTDNDGVADVEDAYPTDANRAYSVNFPSAGYGTLMYEDLWPGRGDYDFNDLVVDYRYTTVTNADNNVVEVLYTFVTRAVGASLHNGFAVQLDGVNKNKITGITGSKASGANWISLNSNGTEAGHATYANFLVFDDAYELFPAQGTSFINTLANAPNLGTDTTRMTVTFLAGGVAPSGGTLSLGSLPNSAFNPYLIVGQDRGKEVHLINKVPTAKVNNAYFGQEQDRSNAAQGKYYLTETNLPYALNVVSSIPYTIEKTDFSEAYLKFVDWAQSGGVTYTDWYLNNSGYRSNTKLMIR